MAPGGRGWCVHRTSLQKTSSLLLGLLAEAGILKQEIQITDADTDTITTNTIRKSPAQL